MLTLLFFQLQAILQKYPQDKQALDIFLALAQELQLKGLTEKKQKYSPNRRNTLSQQQVQKIHT